MLRCRSLILPRLRDRRGWESQNQPRYQNFHFFSSSVSTNILTPHNNAFRLELLSPFHRCQGLVRLSHLPKVIQGSQNVDRGPKGFRPELPRFWQQESSSSSSSGKGSLIVTALMTRPLTRGQRPSGGRFSRSAFAGRLRDSARWGSLRDRHPGSQTLQHPVLGRPQALAEASRPSRGPAGGVQPQGVPPGPAGAR